jgi:hypothetical protein
MVQLSKIVQERMRANAASLAGHPDADLLTAFTERSLAGQARESVLAHLAQCADCRDIVALALPEEDAAVLTPKVRVPWFRLPALRWAAVAAGISVVAVGTFQYRNQNARMAKLSPNVNKTEAVALLTQPAPQIASTEMKTAAPEPAKKLVAKKQLPENLRTEIASEAPRTATHTFTNSLVGRVARGRLGGTVGGVAGEKESPPTASAREFIAAGAGPAAPGATLSAPAPATSQQKIPSVSETVEVSAETAPIQTAQADLGSDKDTLSRAKSPVNDQVQSSQVQANQTVLPIQGRNVTNLQTLSANAVPRWTIASNGALQRSVDDGATWQDVNVTGNESMSALMVQAETPPAKAPKKKSLDKQYAGAFPVFRVVAVNGMEVWAGGNAGILYHTVDAGNSWSRVVPSYEGEPLGGDIVSIQFPDPQHVQISTSVGQTWLTVDSGQSWRKIQ